MDATVPALVNSDWLSSHLDESSVRIVDATWYLPSDGRSGEEEYRQAHIPGAVFWDIDAVADPRSSLPHMLPDGKIFSVRMQELGISRNHHVVVYDNCRMMTSPRVWWTLRAFGHERVSVLDGGMRAWSVAGMPVTRDRTPIDPTTYTASPVPSMVRSLDEIMVNLRSEQLLDARSAGRFAGTVPEPRPECRSGHIPGSCNLPFDTLFDPDTGCFRKPEQLRTCFQNAGIDLEQPVVTTCGSGVTACVLILGMHLLGKNDVAVYDGSWSEWGARSDTPIRTGV